MNGPRGHARERRAAVASLARRDLLEFVRDRRTLFVTLLMPLITYPLLALSSTLGVRTALEEIESQDKPARLAIVLTGADAAGFSARIRAAASGTPGWPDPLDIAVIARADAAAALGDGTADAWIDAGRGTLAALDGDGTLVLDVRLPEGRRGDARRRMLVTTVLRGVAAGARERRIARAGLPPSVLEPLEIGFSGGGPAVAAPVDELVPTVAAVTLVLVALLTATGAFYPAIDAVAGERERGTIETLLVAPCGTGDLVLGKFLAVVAVTLATLAVNVTSLVLTAMVLVRSLPAGVAPVVTLPRIAAVTAIVLPAYVALAAVAAALCMAVTSAARSAKEAQNTLTPVIMLASALAGAALLPGVGQRGWLAAVPFTGQVALARDAVATAIGTEAATGWGTLLVQLAMTCVAAAVATWALLRLTAAALADEETLFRGPDAVVQGLHRPPPRVVPSVWQGLAALLGGLALLWYVQGLVPSDLASAVVVQQVLALVVPLVAAAWWQRIDPRATFSLRPPRLGVALGSVLIGAGLFVLGAAAFVAVREGRSDALSPGARQLAEQLATLVRERPWWISWGLLALLPAACEEWFFRGWVLSALAGTAPSRGRAAAAVAVQAAGFAAFHLLPERMPQTLLLGLVLGWMTLRSGSILPAVLGHLAHNSAPLVLFALADGSVAATLLAGDTFAPPAWVAVAAAAAVVAGVGLFIAAPWGVGRARKPGAA